MNGGLCATMPCAGYRDTGHNTCVASLGFPASARLAEAALSRVIARGPLAGPVGRLEGERPRPATFCCEVKYHG
jgi:hypothetical protein